MKSRIEMLYVLLSAAVLLFAFQPAFSQIIDCDTTLAPERWSEPVRMPDIVNIAPGNEGGGGKYFPSFAPDGKTLFYYSSDPYERIMQTTLTDTGWTAPVRMPAVKDRQLVRGTGMAPDWKRFYYIAWAPTGGWDIFYRERAHKSAAWGPERKLDTAVNSDYTEWTVQVSPDGKKLYYSSGECDNCLGRIYCFGGHDLYVSEWDSTQNTWGQKCNLDYNLNYNIRCDPHPRRTSEEDSPSFTADGRKMYFSKYLEHPYNYELYVAYADSAKNWQKALRLNINSYADSAGEAYGDDYLPAISRDGRMLVFAGKRNTMINGWQPELYISYLVVDEKGDSVITKVDIPQPVNPVSLRLESSPNPFAETMAISLYIDGSRFTTVRVYNAYGGHIRTIYQDYLETGEHSFAWDGRSDSGLRVPKGVYYLRASTTGSAVVRTIVYL